MAEIQTELTKYLIEGLALGVLIYVYLGIVLSTLARKTATPGGGMAWVPILNMLLMCRIARKPGAYVFLLFVPFVNLVVFVMIWMAIARVRGKSPALALLLLVPPVSIIVPWIMASGPAIGAGSAPASVAPPSHSTQCPACGRAECVGDEFCGYTGQRIVPLEAPPVHAAAPPGIAAKALAGVLVLAVIAFMAFGLLSRSGATFGRSAPDPYAAASDGTRAEFPVDSLSPPARPAAVVRREISLGSRVEFPPGAFPALGLADQALGFIVRSVTSADYRVGAPDPPVYVHVFETVPGKAPPAEGLARSMLAAGGASADLTPVRVQSPRGGIYDGFRVRTEQTVSYVLDKKSAPILIVVYATDPPRWMLAGRLAQNSGNDTGIPR